MSTLRGGDCAGKRADEMMEGDSPRVTFHVRCRHGVRRRRSGRPDGGSRPDCAADLSGFDRGRRRCLRQPHQPMRYIRGRRIGQRENGLDDAGTTAGLDIGQASIQPFNAENANSLCAIMGG